MRDYRSFLESVAKRKPSTVNTVLAALNDFYSRRSLGPADVRRLDVAQEAPRSLEKREAIRWPRAVEGCGHPRDRSLALMPFYAGLRIGEMAPLTSTTSASPPGGVCWSCAPGRRATT